MGRSRRGRWVLAPGPVRLQDHAHRRLALAFDPAGQQWLKSHYASTDLPEGAELMTMLRSLSQARTLIKETRGLAAEQEIAIARWQPDWINEFLKPVPGEDPG